MRASWFDRGAAAFVHALADRARLKLALYVPVDGPPQTLWPDQEADAELVAALTGFGRRRLQGRQDAAADEPGVACVLLLDVGGAALGVAVAAKGPGEAWSEPERSMLQLAVESFAARIDARAARAAPPAAAAPDPPAAAPDPPEPPARPAPDARAVRRPAPRPDAGTAICEAVRREELALVYQPELDLITRRVVALEALLRWRHPEHGELGPEVFLPLAERSGIGGEVGAWVVDAAAAALASWRQALPGLQVLVRINVAPEQMAEPATVEQFRLALSRYALPGDALCVELTEHAPLADPARVAQALGELRALGITSAIDDLATGYSTLSQLRSLPVDVIKLDRTLVSGLDRDPRAEAIVTALMGLALNFGLGVVAEGVETEAEAAALLRLGCTRAQGHHLGRPVEQHEALALLRDRGIVTVRN